MYNINYNVLSITYKPYQKHETPWIKNFCEKRNASTSLSILPQDLLIASRMLDTQWSGNVPFFTEKLFENY